MIHLDTSFLIHAMVAGTPQSRKLDQWISEGIDLKISAPAWCEFLCGPVDAKSIELARSAMGIPVAFRAEHAAGASALFNATGRRRGTLVDCMIAAISIGDRATMATDNVEDFRRYEQHGLLLI